MLKLNALSKILLFLGVSLHPSSQNDRRRNEWTIMPDTKRNNNEIRIPGKYLKITGAIF